MSQKSPEVVRLNGPGDLAAALPHLFGFVPTESVVLLGLHGPRKRINLSLRLDLYPPEHDHVIAEDLGRRVLQTEPDAVQIIVLTATPDDDGDLPRRDLVEELVLAVRSPVVDALLVRDGRWWSYLCYDGCQCPSDGRPVNLESSGAVAVAAAHAGLGRSVLPDREAVVRSIAPPRGIAAIGAEQAMDRVCHELELGATLAWRAKALARVRELVDEYADPRITIRADDAARIIVLCHDVPSRDEILGLELDDDASGQLLRLLRDCVRRALPPMDAPVCATFAWLAYAGGEAVVAGAAVDRALASNPDLSLAQLLSEAIHRQVHPQLLREAARGSSGDPLAGDAERSAG
ncbi:MAG TPA: DUF4192 domain-containing protein [Mycobacteriales bacterium]|nr:DUF4192 domain-containing protein [Mycobacteriales bacterium]